MSKYKHIFFDLDHTLWDFETNSRETLLEIIADFSLLEKGLPSTELFINRYQQINTEMWDVYRKGLLDRLTLRNTRFHRALLEFDIDDYELSLKLGEQYLKRSPIKKNLFEGALQALSYLKNKYTLHIITNGFNEVQFIKLEHSQLAPFFTHIITSEAANSKKPEKEIFDFALNLAQAKSSESIMIGDSLAEDIQGARNYGIDQIYFNPHKNQHMQQVTFEISSLLELMVIL